jgi:hypothetical protein
LTVTVGIIKGSVDIAEIVGIGGVEVVGIVSVGITGIGIDEVIVEGDGIGCED